MSDGKKQDDKPPPLFGFTTYAHQEKTTWGGPAFDEFKREENISKHGLEKICPKCNGTGNKQRHAYWECEDCKGTGLKP